MAGTAKRKASDDVQSDAVQRGQKRLKDAKSRVTEETAVTHVILDQFYPKLQTLRSYLLGSLPGSSRLRRKKIASIGRPGQSRSNVSEEVESLLCRTLDSVLVGTFEDKAAHPRERWEQFTAFSQRGDESYVSLSDGLTRAEFSQSEVCEVSKTHRVR